jgi:hypothetical protein
MPVFSIWVGRFPPEHVGRGREVTAAIWQEMPQFPGHLRAGELAVQMAVVVSGTVGS